MIWTLPWRRSGRGADARPERKAESGFIALHLQGEASWTRRDYATLSREGFMRNPVVHRAVRLIAQAASAVPLVLYEGAAEVTGHPLLALLDRPNARQAGASFLEALYGHLLIAGNAYVELTEAGPELRELHLLRPDRTAVLADAQGWPAALEHRVGTGRRVVPLGAGSGLHLALFHPLDDQCGFPPLEAALMALDTHNAAGRWNKALLDNSARPSGALVYAPKDGGNLSADQFDRLKTELEEGYSGASRAGRPLLLEGGLDWKTMGLSPKDMDFIEAKNGASRDIALAFGVPPMLLGIPGDNTYANYQEANRAFYRMTVLPLVARIVREFSVFLAPSFGADLRLRYDADQVEGLAAEREALWARVSAADFLSDDEKREAVGYAPRGGLHSKAGYRTDQPRVLAGNPDGGQWTEESGAPAASDQSSGEDVRVAQSVQIDLLAEEQIGGHTIRSHVGRSPGELLRRVRGERYFGLFETIVRYRDGSFPSIQAASKLVSATISKNPEVVHAVATGVVAREFITANFLSKTGIEAFRRGPFEQPYIGDTFGVGVVIAHDPGSPKGYRIVTAYPRND